MHPHNQPWRAKSRVKIVQMHKNPHILQIIGGRKFVFAMYNHILVHKKQSETGTFKVIGQGHML